MCDYCDFTEDNFPKKPAKKLLNVNAKDSSGNDVGYVLMKDRHFYYIKDSFSHDMVCECVFCPMCGRKLDE